MSTAVLIAAVVGGGVLFLMRRLFPSQKSVKLLQYPADTMQGKTVIVTGANSGIGKALAGELLKLRARVIMACRDQRRAEEAAEDIKKEAGAEQGQVVIKHLDLASLQSVRKFCEEISKVSCIVWGSVDSYGLFVYQLFKSLLSGAFLRLLYGTKVSVTSTFYVSGAVRGAEPITTLLPPPLPPLLPLHLQYYPSPEVLYHLITSLPTAYQPIVT